MNSTVSVTDDSATLSINYAESAYSIIDTERLEYRTCLNCARHPRYPEVPVVSLHKGAQCMVCNGRKPVQK